MEEGDLGAVGGGAMKAGHTPAPEEVIQAFGHLTLFFFFFFWEGTCAVGLIPPPPRQGTPPPRDNNAPVSTTAGVVSAFFGTFCISLGDIQNVPTLWVLALFGIFYKFCFHVQTCRYPGGGGGYVYNF